jgi:hypothetical protein
MSHLIRQQFLHIDLEGTESAALELQRILPRLCNNTLKSAIARALERAAPPDGHLCIDKVELDLGVLQLERLEGDLAEAVKRALQNWLHENTAVAAPHPSLVSDVSRHDTFSDPPGIRFKTTDDAVSEALIHFLRNGTLPWSFRVPRGGSLEELVLASWENSFKAGGAAPMLLVLAEPTARRRLVRQFSERFLQLLLADLAARNNPVVEEIRKELRLRQQEESAAAYSDAIETAQRTASDDEHPEATEGLYIDNAGLVLLHPFLPRLFTALGLSDEERLLQPDRALCLLHYLATGQPAAPEYELALPKLLCGVPLPAPVSTLSELRDAEKEEAQALLEAVIRHWDALRNSTPDELRGSFLLRPGKLSLKRDGDWLLQVEPQTTDILLQKLPWGFSIVKFPWMQTMLWVEWG